MYSTCLFCNSSLGTNEAIEHFPVGTRLAFDPAKGRLWIICDRCERWNLTPLEERWEAIEECERAYSGTKRRATTANIGLARLADGTTLVRIGASERAELAAWRYGDQFGRRRRRNALYTASTVAVGGGLVLSGPLIGLAFGAALVALNLKLIEHTGPPSLTLNGGPQALTLDRNQLREVQLRLDDRDGYQLEIPRSTFWRSKATFDTRLHELTPEPYILRGETALAAASVLLARINFSGGSARTVQQAISMLDSSDARSAIRKLASSGYDKPATAQRFRGRTMRPVDSPGRLSAFAPAARFALEMALHEEDERRALAGELAPLEQRWKEAEEIAAISDSMFVPATILERVRRRS